MHGFKAFALIISLLVLDINAETITAANYHYPYKDPYLATSTVALLHGEAHIPSVDIHDLETAILAGRNNIYLLEGMGKLRYRFYQQAGLAPLVFIIPGIASSAYGGSAVYMAEFLASHGYHVLVLPSPLHWNFYLSAGRSRFPGYNPEDAKDLYLVMRLVLAKVQTEYQAQIGKIGVLGLSAGAKDAAFVSALERSQSKIGIQTYLLINPPIDALKAAEKIDSMTALGNKLTDDQRSQIDSYALGVIEDAQNMPMNDTNYFTGWEHRLHLTDAELKYLIGGEIQQLVSGTLYTSSILYDQGILTSPISWGNRSARIQEAQSHSLMSYTKEFLLPNVSQTIDSKINLTKLNKQTSLKSLKSELETNTSIYLMHNHDDFLISKEDLDFLKIVFGDRAIFYPYGGHLGNLWYDKNKLDILHVFKQLNL